MIEILYTAYTQKQEVPLREVTNPRSSCLYADFPSVFQNKTKIQKNLPFFADLCYNDMLEIFGKGKEGNGMTAAEKLERAKSGDRSAYDLLCADSADRLYAAAVLALGRPEDARDAVKNAFRDGYAQIAQIRDGAHLQAWLSRELTKHLVARIKEYRAEGIKPSGEDRFSNLPSLDRIVCAIAYAFHYNIHEISVITGLKEETVEKKLSDSEKKLGEEKAAVLRKLEELRFPEEKQKKLSVPSPSGVRPNQIEPPAPEKDLTAKEKARSSGEKSDAPAPAAETGTAAGGKPLDAKTFIGVISGQRITGKEFLQLIGNTRISNDVYREIQENPNLTKGRLIELLENSPLTSEDYYKLLSAIKRRNELLEWKEKKEQEQRRQTKQAGLFTMERKKSAPAQNKKETRVEKTGPFTPPINTAVLGQLSGEEPEEPEKKKKRGRSEDTGAFTPPINTAMLGQLSGEESEEPEKKKKRGRSEETGAFPPPVDPAALGRRPGEEPERSAPRKKPDAPASEVFRPTVPDLGDDDEAESPRREKYKGKEFFIDDDVYYRGVNNGKLAFCAVCAALLIAGSFGIRFLTTGTALPTEKETLDEPPPSVPTVTIESAADVLAAAAEMKSRVQKNTLQPYRTGAQPYSEPLTDDFRAAGDSLYFLRQGAIRAVTLSPEAPRVSAELPLSADGDLIGFTAYEDRVCLVYDEEGASVRVEVYDKALSPIETYRQDGRYSALWIGDGIFTLVTSVTPAGGHTVLPSYRIGETKQTLGVEEILIADNAVCGGFSVIGTVSGGEPRVSAVLGGYDTYAAFDGDRITLLLPDWNTTHLIRLRRIGTGTELLSQETVRGECYGADCLSAEGDCIVSYNSAEGMLIAQKKTEEGYARLEGFAEGERLSGVSYLDGMAYIVTETENETKLYCVDFTGEEPMAAEANPNAVYYEKLSGFGENLIGLSAESDADGKRTALLLSIYGYGKESGLSVLRSARIGVDENTAPEYARYLSGDAEENNERIAVSEDGKYAAVSYVAFDGISEIERFVCFADNGLSLDKTAELSFYDIQSKDRIVAIRDGILYAVTDHRITTVDLATGEKTEFRAEG